MSKKSTMTPESLKREGYQLHEVLGEGAYSVVYRSTNTKHPGVNYACKRYKINSRTIKWVERCLHREMTLVMKVRHRSIVEAYTAIRAGDEAFLILQFAPNGSVRAYLRKKLPEDMYLTEHKVRFWISDLFAAVAYLHSKEIAHRDIKTDNFLLNEEMRPLLCDFSFACISDKPDTRFVCMVDTVCGTPGFLAPEVHSLKSGQRYDAKLSDVYALGICLYEMLVKKVPYQGKWKLGDEELIKLQMARSYTYPSKLQASEECRQLVAMLLEPNPNRRITINRALGLPWFSKGRSCSGSHARKSSSKSNSSENFRNQSAANNSKCSSKKEKKTSKSSRNSKTHKTKKPDASEADQEAGNQENEDDTE